MDYLLRDSHHIGVAYGKFDHYRLIDTLRILPAPPSDECATDLRQSREPSLGVEEGGLQSAEALLLARYFMYSQVYFHPVRRIYDIHLTDFLREWLPGGKFSTDIENHLLLTDNEINAALYKAAFQGQEHAQRIVLHKHFKVLYRPSRDDIKMNPEAGLAVFQAAADAFGTDKVRYDRYAEKGEVSEFPVFTDKAESVSSTSISQVLGDLPLASVDCVFVERDLLDEAREWLEDQKALLIQPEEETP
jgi:HD superfamily phosphohydrolase